MSAACRYLLLFAILLLSTGCADRSDEAPLTREAHPPGWLEIHGERAQQDLDSCRACHGAAFEGRGAAVSCFLCHPPGRPFTRPAPHPVGPEFLLPQGHVAAYVQNAEFCHQCHAMEGPGLALACTDCHTAGSPLLLGGCSSCHNVPPDSGPPSGPDGPNRAGAHPGHTALPAPANQCGSCHQGAGSGSQLHWYADPEPPADVIFSAAFQGRGGAASYQPETGSCLNVSCHGGQQSPDWWTGALDVAGACSACHELGTAPQSPEFNSYFSGRHGSHANENGYARLLGYQVSCWACHDLARLQVVHFAGLETPEFTDPAVTLNPAIGYAQVPSPRCMTNISGCHPGSLRPW